MFCVADNLQITNQTIEKAINGSNPEPIQALATKCLAAGAQAIDINAGPLTKHAENKMKFCVETIQAVCDLPIIIDTANPTAIEAGLKICPKGAIINGFSLESAKLEKILPLAVKYDAVIIGYLLYADGQVPMNAAERLNVGVQIWEKAQKAGVRPEKLIIDPIVVPVTWQDGHRQAMEVLTVLKHLPDLLGFEVKTVAGLSNLTAGLGNDPRRLVLEKSYLAMLAGYGLDMVLLNVFHDDTMAVARACDALISPKVFSLVTI